MSIPIDQFQRAAGAGMRGASEGEVDRFVGASAYVYALSGEDDAAAVRRVIEQELAHTYLLPTDRENWAACLRRHWEQALEGLNQIEKEFGEGGGRLA